MPDSIMIGLSFLGTRFFVKKANGDEIVCKKRVK